MLVNFAIIVLLSEAASGAALRSATLLKQSLRHRCFPVNHMAK